MSTKIKGVSLLKESTFRGIKKPRRSGVTQQQ